MQVEEQGPPPDLGCVSVKVMVRKPTPSISADGIGYQELVTKHWNLQSQSGRRRNSKMSTKQEFPAILKLCGQYEHVVLSEHKI